MGIRRCSTGSQLHDLNPSDYHPTGLFWTLPIPEQNIEVHPGNGYASIVAKNLPIYDYGQIPNALFEPADLGQAARPILTVHRFDLLRDGASGVLYQLSFSAS